MMVWYLGRRVHMYMPRCNCMNSDSKAIAFWQLGHNYYKRLLLQAEWTVNSEFHPTRATIYRPIIKLPFPFPTSRGFKPMACAEPLDRFLHEV